MACIMHGRIRQAEQVWRCWQQAASPAHELRRYRTRHAGHGITLAEQAIREGATVLISLGGDGTLNEVVNGLMQAQQRLSPADGQQLRLCAMSGGTGNDFLRSIGGASDFDAILAAIEADRVRHLDAGHVRFQTRAGPQERYFINITDLGMGGLIAQRLHRYPKWLGSQLPYQLAILRTFFTYRHQRLALRAANWEEDVSVMSLVAANGRYFGSGLGIAPQARPDDGQLAIVILGNISIWDYLRHLPQLRRCEPIDHPEVHYTSVTEIELTGNQQPLPIDMDGEYIGTTPMHIQICPGIVPWLDTR